MRVSGAVRCIGRCRIAETLLIATKRALTLGLVAKLPPRTPLHYRLFADNAARTIETGMTTGGAECLMGILDRLFELHPATRIAAVMAQALSTFLRHIACLWHLFFPFRNRPARSQDDRATGMSECLGLRLQWPASQFQPVYSRHRRHRRRQPQPQPRPARLHRWVDYR
jgi:hypothetical protein